MRIRRAWAIAAVTLGVVSAAYAQEQRSSYYTDA
jgi:hypothetical protein